MRVDTINKIIVIPQHQLKASAREEKLKTIERYDFPISRKPIEDAQVVVVYNNDSFIFIKDRSRFFTDDGTIRNLEDLTSIQVISGVIYHLIELDKKDTLDLEDFDFENIFGLKRKS